MSLSLASAFWLLSILLVLVPGADWAYAISAGLKGRARIAASVAGLAVGCLAAAAVVAAGVGAMVSNHPGAIKALTIVGAAYLVWLGIGLLRSKPAALGESEVDRSSLMSWFSKGIAISGLNPKLLLLLLALLPQFISTTGRWSAGTQIFVLGTVHAVNCLIVYFLVGTAAEAVLRSRPAASLLVSRLSGVAMLVISATLVVEQVHQA